MFTSPTYYLSFANVNASDACGTVGGTVTSTIVPIAADQLSSIWAAPAECFQEGADMVTWAITNTATFNITDILTTPVPLSIRTSQIWCASAMFCAGPSVCAADIPYRPQLVVPDSVLQRLSPAWASCSADLRGLFDPPIALTETNVVASPTTPVVQTSNAVPATPASGPSSAGPSRTAGISSTQETVAGTVDSVSVIFQTSNPSNSQESAGSTADPTVVSDQTAHSSVVSTADPILESDLSTNPTSNDPPSPSDSMAKSASSDRLLSVLASILGSTTENDLASSTDLMQGSVTTALAGTVNALSVLSEADDSFALDLTAGFSSTATRINGDPTNGPAGSGIETVRTVSEAAILTSGTTVATAQSVATPSTGLASGTDTVQNDQTTKITSTPISAASDSIIMAGSTVQPMQIATLSAETAAIYTGSDGHVVTIVQQGSSAVVQDGSSTSTVPLGVQATIDSQTVNVPSAGGSEVTDSSRLAFSVLPVSAADLLSTQAVITAASQGQVTVLQQGSSYLVNDGGNSITVAAGAAATMDGDTISIPSSDGFVIVNGVSAAVSTLTQDSLASAAQSKAVVAGSDGQFVTIIQAGSSILVEDASAEVTMSAGAQVTMDGLTISAPGLIGGVHVNGNTVTFTNAAASLSSVDPTTEATSSDLVTSSSSQPGAPQSISSTATSGSRLSAQSPGLVLIWIALCYVF